MIKLCLILFMSINGAYCEDVKTEISSHQVFDLALQVGFNYEDAIIAECVALHESSNRPGVVDYDINFGLMQINKGWFWGFDGNEPNRPDLNPQILLDPSVNMEVAYYIKNRSSWKAWSVFEEFCDV